jgi:hypothetical protein
MAYAQDTSVSVERTKAEIEALITRFGADRFMTGHSGREAGVAFTINGRTVQFRLPLPDRSDRVFHVTPHRRNQRTADEAYRAWEQACRSRWRALFLCIKAKLEAITAGITTFESEFLAHIVMPNGMTFGEHVIPQIEEMVKGNQMPQLQIGFTSHEPTT